jgi:hypothetical protein
MLGPEFPVKFRTESVSVRMLDSEGCEIPYPLTVLRSDLTLDNTLLRSLLPKDRLVEWKFHGVPLFVTFAHDVTESLIQAAKRGITVFGNSKPGLGSTPRLRPNNL